MVKGSDLGMPDRIFKQIIDAVSTMYVLMVAAF